MGPQNVKILGPRGPRILKSWGPGGPKIGGPYFHMTPGFPFLRDFRDPVVIIGTPFSTQTTDDTGDANDSGGYSQSSGKKWPSVKRPI